MREDMSRVIVERPRIGGDRKRKGRARPMEDLPRHEGMRRPHDIADNRKWLNENLNPLRRYLERQVGRPWDKVYSEISQHLRAGNTVQQHVRDHLHDFVAIKPRRMAGGYRTRSDGLWYQPLYVDPKDGILKRTDRLPELKKHRRSRRGRQEPPDRVALAPDRELRRIDGLWYEITLAPLPEPEYRASDEARTIQLKRGRAKHVIGAPMTVRRLVTPPVRDIVNGTAVLAGPKTDDEAAWLEHRRKYPDRRYAVGKRALSRAELRRHGLQNLLPEE